MSPVSAGPGSAAPARRSQLFRLKPVDVIVAQHEEAGGSGLRRSMGLLQLTALSIGATLGTGIFVILGEAVPLAGPAIVLAFVLEGDLEVTVGGDVTTLGPGDAFTFSPGTEHGFRSLRRNGTTRVLWVFAPALPVGRGTI